MSIFDRIETRQFAAHVAVESGLRPLVRNLGSQDETVALYAKLQNGELSSQTVFQRVSMLANQTVDARFENPNDIALATYLWALLRYDPSLARAAGEIVLGTNGLYWAYKLASRIIENRSLHTESENSVAVVAGDQAVGETSLSANAMLVSPLVNGLARQKESITVSHPSGTGAGPLSSNAVEIVRTAAANDTAIRPEAHGTTIAVADVIIRQ